jgi:hypothetical protein
MATNLSRDILSKLRMWHHPSVGGLQFRGLMVEEAWLIPSQHRVTFSIAMMLLFVVLMAKLSFDWSTAWTVGTVFIGMVALSTRVSIMP